MSILDEHGLYLFKSIAISNSILQNKSFAIMLAVLKRALKIVPAWQ